MTDFVILWFYAFSIIMKTLQAFASFWKVPPLFASLIHFPPSPVQIARKLFSMQSQILNLLSYV